MERPDSRNQLFDIAWQFRVNRFRDTWLAGVPCPLPEHYVLGFDEQKIETEGMPDDWQQAVAADNLARASQASGDGALRRVPTMWPGFSDHDEPDGKATEATRST